MDDRPEDPRENQVAEELLEWLSGEVLPGFGTGDGEATAVGRLAREHLEVLGALPFALDEAVPSPATRTELLRAIAGSKSPGVDSRAARAPEGTDGVLVPLPPRTRSGAGRLLFPLAAILALAVGVSAWQWGRIGDQKETIERLATRLSDVNREASQLAELQGELEAVRSKLAMVTSAGLEVCNLEPVGESPTYANSHGALFVASDHQRWYLKIDGLEPCPLGRVYQLWFIGPEGRAHSAGTFEVESGVKVELTSETMPEGTRAVRVTLEPKGGSEQPSGPEVLIGDEVARVL